MISFGANLSRKYTKNFTALIVAAVTLCGNSSASEFNFLGRRSNVTATFPFEQGPGYLPGGREFPYSLTKESGEEFLLSDLKGKVVIVVLSTTWCPNCPVVLKNFDNLLHRLKLSEIEDVKILVLNVGHDTVEALKLYYKSHDIQLLEIYPSVKPQVMEGIVGVPACLVFDKKGNHVWGYLGGGIDYAGDEFFNFIERLAHE
ncbi:MAG: TlpA family protein disulfide reductase [Holosporaceae bacterium]|jgi:thiol-disulfide isomerase/thioredoxin|nr:TlpA family protein disulfide reductase [Holosporaceae bacterium]